MTGRPVAARMFSVESAEARIERMARVEAERIAAEPLLTNPTPPPARPKSIYGGRRRPHQGRMPFATPEAEIGVSTEPKVEPPIDFVIEDDGLGAQIHAFLADLRMASAYVERGIDAPTRALFSGPSGVGKTMCVKWIGQQIGRPVRIVKVAGVVDKYLGESGKNVAREFKEAAAAGAILFLDEIDGICQKRTATEQGQCSDEMQRVTSTLFQLLDNLPPEHVVVAATNFPTKLDDALLRRLPFTVEFVPPGLRARAEMARRWLAKADLGDAFAAQLVAASDGLSGAAFRSLVMARARDAIRSSGGAA